MHQMDKMISCDLTFLPIQSKDYIHDIKNVISLVENSGLEFIIGEMSTIFKGNSSKVFNLLNAISEEMHDKTKFAMVIKISNECGCKG